MRGCRLVIAVIVLLGAVLSPLGARAQTAQRGRLLVTVTDPSGGVIPGAAVAVAGLEPATREATLDPVKSVETGVATIANLLPGRYSVSVEFPGFTKGVVRDLRVRAGDNRQTLVLVPAGVEESLTVGRDRKEAASDRGAAFGSALTREQIDALSDDPEEMRRQLQQMAGGDAVIRVDSFEGQDLPPKSMIKSIRISRDQFSAENHFAGGLSIEIVTQPGIGPLRGGIGTTFYDSSTDGKNPLVGLRPASRNTNLRLAVGGTLIKQRSSFQLSFVGTDAFQTPVQVSSNADGIVRTLSNVQQPSKNVGFSGLIDYALTRDQTIRLGVNRSSGHTENLGLGGNNDSQRAFSTRNTSTIIRAQELGPLGRRFFTNTRVLLNIGNNESTSVFEAPTVVIPDSVTTGGAQTRGGSHNRAFQIGSDLDYVRGTHSVRTGVLIDGGHYRSDSSNNYLGTYTFESVEAFQAGRPRSYTRRIGDPNVNYWNVQAGIYILDDIKVRKGLTITPGLRYEVQTHLPDRMNFGPRFGVTWSPGQSGKTTLRASAGIFHDWLTTNTYEQTIRVDGFRQQEINIINPSFPDPGSAAAPPTNRYVLGSDLIMGRTTRLSAGVNQQLSKRISSGVTYSYTRGIGQLVGQNLNAPVNGVRPDPAFANVIRSVSDGNSRVHSLNANLSVSLSSAIPGPRGTGKLLDFKRGLFLGVNYGTGRNQNNTDGAFATPATNDLGLEWGPAAFDVRHRGGLSLSTSFLRNFNAQVSLNGNSATPLTIRTGIDDNGDLIFNDRPAGVGRNSARTAGQFNSFGFFSYSFSLGTRKVMSGGGVQITSSGGQLVVNPAASQAAPRYQLNIGVQISNLTNHANYTGYTGVMTSKLFLQPTQSDGVRRTTFNLNVSF
ncbi:MAG: carboxypeptidase regulatory-like domain-containing protein [Vicinamibacterales bacterium]